MVYEWFTVAMNKMWEGFWYTLGAGLALGIFVSFFVNYIRKFFNYGNQKFANSWLGNVIKKLNEIVEENKDGDKRKKRTL